MPETTDIMLQQISEIEQKDENQIMAELAGETVKEYFYEITRYNKKLRKDERIVKLSWVGVREVARSRGNIMVEEPIITETEDAMRFVVRANDLTRNFSVFGGTHQPKKQTIKITDKDGNEVGTKQEDDPHYFAKGLSKAQRNALNLCIPGDYAVKLIDRFLRAAGKTPLFLKAANIEAPDIVRPRKPDTKPREYWDKVTEDQILDYHRLELIMWSLCKIQPKDIYKELGVSSRSDMTIDAWDAFQQLKEHLAPGPKE
jgi:hypothetical protein